MVQGDLAYFLKVFLHSQAQASITMFSLLLILYKFPIFLFLDLTANSFNFISVNTCLNLYFGICGSNIFGIFKGLI